LLRNAQSSAEYASLLEEIRNKPLGALHVTLIFRTEVGQVFAFFYSRRDPHEQGGEEAQSEPQPADLFAPGAPAEQDKAAVHGMAYQCEDAADDELGSVLKREVF